MLKYTDETLLKMYLQTDNFIHFLQECKYAGSWDTKVDLNTVIKMISNYQFIVKNITIENKKLEEKVKILEDKIISLENIT